jgi:hypothetical protein
MTAPVIYWGKLPGSVDWADGWVAYVYLNESWGSFHATDPEGYDHIFQLPTELTEFPYGLDADIEVTNEYGVPTGFWVRARSADPAGTVMIGRRAGI